MNAALSAQIARREAVITRIKQILIQGRYVDAAPDAIDLDVALFGTGLGIETDFAPEIATAVEIAFGVTLPAESMVNGLRTFNSLVDLVLDSEDRERAA
jgi:hypothetical protein